MKFRKKPVVIEAFEWQPGEAESWAEIPGDAPWFLAATLTGVAKVNGDGTCSIKTLEGTMIANRGDFIIKGVAGEIYPCKPDIFAKSYEAA